MPYAGKTIIARDLAREARKYWRNYELTKAVAVALGESKGSVGAWHDNLDSQGVETSRDCGVYQINIPARLIGTDAESALRTDSLDPAVWTPVFENNVERASEMYNAAWVRDGKQDIRRWQAWVAYTSGWATFPYAWVWHHDADGNPVGPWVATGRYIHKAIAGQMNNLVINEKEWTAEVALSYGKKYAAHFGIADGSELAITKDKAGQELLIWHYPAAPSAPPASGDLYPQPNNGV